MIEAIVLVGISGVLALLGWTLKQNNAANGFLQRMDERDKQHGVEIERLRTRTHDHGNELQKHEGRITNLERNNYN